MENPKFDYSNPRISATKIAYDLSMIYAKAKFEHKLYSGYDFDTGNAPEAIEEQEYLIEKCFSAFDYYLCMEPGELEERLVNLSGDNVSP